MWAETGVGQFQGVYDQGSVKLSFLVRPRWVERSLCFSIILLFQGLPLALSPFHSLPAGRALIRSVFGRIKTPAQFWEEGRRGAPGSQIGKEQVLLSLLLGPHLHPGSGVLGSVDGSGQRG